MRTLRRTCATIATLRRPSSVEAAMRSGWLVRSCLAPARSGPLATSALVPANMTMQAAVLRIGLYRWRSCKNALRTALLLSFASVSGFSIPQRKLRCNLLGSAGDDKTLLSHSTDVRPHGCGRTDPYARLYRCTNRPNDPRWRGRQKNQRGPRQPTKTSKIAV